MNPIEKAIQGGNKTIDTYLANVSHSDFQSHIGDLKNKYSDKGAIKQTIQKLQELL